MRAIFTHTLDVRFRDCDPLGHANNAVYLTYLEQARLAHWRALWRFGEPEAPPWPGVILARAEVDYVRAARFGDVLQVRIFLAAVGRTSFTYEYEVVDENGGTVARARSVQVMYDYAAGTPVPIPEELRHLFSSL